MNNTQWAMKGPLVAIGINHDYGSQKGLLKRCNTSVGLMSECHICSNKLITNEKKKKTKQYNIELFVFVEF